MRSFETKDFTFGVAGKYLLENCDMSMVFFSVEVEIGIVP